MRENVMMEDPTVIPLGGYRVDVSGETGEMAGTLMCMWCRDACTRCSSEWQGWGALAGCLYVTRRSSSKRPNFSSRKTEDQQQQQTIDITLHHTPLLQQIFATSPKIGGNRQEQHLLINNHLPDANVRQAQPIPWPLAYARRCAVQITCALSNTSRRLKLSLSLAQQRPSNRQWQTRQPQSQSLALTHPLTLTQQLAPSIHPPSEPRPPTAQRQNRHRKTHKERQRGAPARDLRQLRRHPGPRDADQPPVPDEPRDRVRAVCHPGGCRECDCAHARSTARRCDDQCLHCVA